MITVTEEAREIFREIDNPDGTVLRLEPIITDQQTEETRVRLAPANRRATTRWSRTKEKTYSASPVPSAKP
ncbi:MAG TPA: hypothetical protein VK357_06525 [Rubrobacteraceae bacterium]|jgi:hypothetical protein|nr:hypothetical protein [Rubrobacteraceae bacterium]